MRYKFKTRPYAHQLKALKRAIRQRHIGILWEPGTGKTKFVVDWSCALHQAGQLDRVLIIAPLSVVGVWEEEYETHAPISYDLSFIDRKTKSIPVRSKQLHIVVVNYDIIWRRPELVTKYRPQMVVADESHKIKKPSARRSRFVRSLHTVPYRAILTGTPNPKSYVDLYGQWVFLNPKRFGTRVDDFKDEYVRYGGYMKRQVMGYRNVNVLQKKVKADAMIRRKDQCLDLPERTYQRVPVTLEPKAWEAYQRMAYELFLELKKGDTSDAKNVAVKILRLQQITGGWIKSDEGNLHRISQAKMVAAAERMEDVFDDDEKLVVFARFRPEVRALGELGARLKVPTHVLIGGQGRAERDASRREFQAAKGKRLFVAQIQTGGLGITLHSAHEVLFYSVTYALDDYIQACDRVHRIGQTHAVRYQHLTATATIDLDIYGALRTKNDLMGTIMGTPKGRRVLMMSLAKNLGIDRPS